MHWSWRTGCSSFKRTVRETALRHGIFATFMAKPMEQEPGSAMHIHQSILDAEGNNIFSLPDGSASPLFGQCIAGLQAYIPQLMPMFAPYANSYRRLSPFMSAPINVRWGTDNRTCGIRIPKSSPANRRVENRVPGVDVNPYLAMAATLACCYLGMTEGLTPSAPTTDSAWNVSHELPRHLEDAIASMRSCEPMREGAGRRLRGRLLRREGTGIRHLQPRDQLLGARALVALGLDPHAPGEPP